MLPQIAEGITLIVTGATILVRLTPTDKDNKVLDKIRRVLERVSNLFLPDRKKRK